MIVLALGFIVVLRRIDKLVVDSIVQLRIVVDFVLAVLVTTPRRKLYHVSFILHVRHLQHCAPKGRQITHRRVEWRQNHRFGASIAQGLIHRVQVQLSEAVPRLVITHTLTPVESRRVVIGEF